MIQPSCRFGTEIAMGNPYSQDLRERVIAAVDVGTGAYVAAPLFRVSVSYIYKALIRRRMTGEVTARRSGGGPQPKLAPHDQALRARIAAEPDITLAELQAWLLAERKIKVSIGCLWNSSRFSTSRSKKVGAGCRAGSARCGPSA
jgi:transposase